LLRQELIGFEEDNPEVHKTFRAQTRDIDLSINLVCLHKTEGGLYFFDKEGKPIIFKLEVKLRPDLPKNLLRNAISLQNPAIIKYFIEQQPPLSWREDATLRHCRYAIFENSINEEISGFTLRLSQKMGLEIIPKPKP
jgi:hypothetical protein